MVGRPSWPANTMPTIVASAPTPSTVCQKANTAARNGAAANSPTKLARLPSAISTADTTASSMRAAPRPARDPGFSERRPDEKIGMGTPNSMPDRRERLHQLDP
jgi:hypothetical protein